jgi:soluble lytic murein transglycosylase
LIRPAKLFVAACAAVFVVESAIAQAQIPTSPVVQPTAPMSYRAQLLSSADSQALDSAIRAVLAADLSGAESYRAQISDPLAQKIVRWFEADQLGNQLSFLELDAARRDFAGWPRAGVRQAYAERAMESVNMAPDRVIAWFDGAPPQTAEGAMALAGALQASGRAADAQALIKSWWRERLFEADVQARMLARYGAWLTQEDHARRLDTLLLGPQGPATLAMLSLLPDDYRKLAEASIALRNEASDANAKFNAVPASVASSPALAFDRARYLRKRGLDTLTFNLVRNFPTAPIDDDSADRVWTERKFVFNAAIRARDYATATAAMSNHGFPTGERKSEAEFFAGWVALRKLNDPATADKRFANIATPSSTPITQGRAAYWRGRAAEARGDTVAAQGFYQAGAQWTTTFYGQLSAEKVGMKTLTIGRDPVPTEADRQRFEGREMVRAARMLAESGQPNTFKLFVQAIDDVLPSVEEVALLVDLARYYGDQDLSMKVARAGAQRGFILPERGYPLVSVPTVPGAAEPAFALSIARQETNFYPQARSGADARGMMQLIPPTARAVANRLGVPWDVSRLYEAEYNMRLGAYHLGELIDSFGGSYAMASAGYNAGPNRPAVWAAECGDPRGGSTDPLDFVECIPFSETRNYVMRTLETMEVYRARLNGGSTPLTLSLDLKRGAYGYNPVPLPPSSGGITPLISPVSYDAPTRPAAKTGPHKASSHKASKSKTSRKTSGAKASRGKASAAKRPASKTSTRSAKRAARHKS